MTLTRGVTDVDTIYATCTNEIGFFEVGFAPVTSGDIARLQPDRGRARRGVRAA